MGLNLVAHLVPGSLLGPIEVNEKTHTNFTGRSLLHKKGLIQIRQVSDTVESTELITTAGIQI